MNYNGSKECNVSSISVLNFRGCFFSLDNENKMSAFQMLAISLSDSFCQKTAILYIVNKTLSGKHAPAGSPRWHSAASSPSTALLSTGYTARRLPHPAQRNSHAKKPPNYTTLPAV